MPLPDDTQNLINEMIQEMNNTNSSRVRTLLLTNLVEVTIKDCIEKLFGSTIARDIPRNTIVKILEEKHIITSNGASDLSQIFSIRDIYAHKISLSEADNKAEQILSNMKIVQDRKPDDWDERNTARKIFNTADWFVFWLTQAYNSL